MTAQIRYFPIRHHSPMCARALEHALSTWQPDFICLEASAEADQLMKDLQVSDLKPPIAILAFQPHSLNRAHFLPFADYSPEWIAMQFIHRNQVAYDFIDLPQKHTLALAQLSSWDELIQQAQDITQKHQAPNKPTRKLKKIQLSLRIYLHNFL